MLRTVFEGYLLCALFAVAGFSVLGGSVLFWMTFVWLFGAVATVGVAYLRSAERSARPLGVRAQQVATHH